MHTRALLPPSAFDITIDNAPATLDDLFPDWSLLDRFGMIVTEPFASLGASLLIQAAISRFYATPRGDAFPEIYLFHVGGRHGDHSNFDFWPPRKEVFLDNTDAATVLAAVNDRAITRLAVPHGAPGDTAALATGPSSWAEQADAHSRLRSCFAYSANGVTPSGTVTLHSSDRNTDENPHDSLDLQGAVDRFLGLSEEEFLAKVKDAQGDFATPQDAYNWTDCAKARTAEVSSELTRGLLAERALEWQNRGGITQVVRRIETDECLSLIVSSTASCTDAASAPASPGQLSASV